MDVVVEEKFPLHWMHFQEEPSTMEHLRRITANEEALRAISLMEDPRLDLNEEHERSSDIQRIESKVNIVLDLVALLARQSSQLPPMYPTRLASTFIEWQCSAAPQDGQSVIVQVYLSVKYPRPVQLVGIAEAVAADSIFNCRVNLSSAGEVQQDLLEKYIFRQHRRRVALERRNNNPM